MARLSDYDRQRGEQALKSCIEKTNHIADAAQLNKVASDILIQSLGDNPELLRRACETYNHTKSLYKLSHSDDNTRGDSFAILNTPEIYEQAVERLRTNTLMKAASATPRFKPLFTREEQQDTAPMQKAASAPVQKQASVIEDNRPEWQLRAELDSELRKWGDLLIKLASKEANAGTALSRALDRYQSVMTVQPAAFRKEAAAVISTAYGAFGDSLIARFNEARPMFKVASYKKLPHKGSIKVPRHEVYEHVALVKQANSQMLRATNIKERALQDVLGCLKSMNFDVLRKQAGAGGILASSMMLNTLGNQMPDAFGVRDGDNEKVRENLKSAQLRNNLRELETKRVFYDALEDDYISSFPLEDIVKAYNASLQSLPPTEQQRPGWNKQLLVSRMTERLGRGNIPSAADEEKILRAAEALSRQQRYTDDQVDSVNK